MTAVIVGAAETDAIGRLPDHSAFALHLEGARNALADAGLTKDDVDGIATVAETYLNGQLILRSESMWREHAIDVGGLIKAENELVIVCRALTPLMAKRRRPASRWRTRSGTRPPPTRCRRSEGSRRCRPPTRRAGRCPTRP